MVMLGLEEKLQVVPFKYLREQIAFIVSVIGRGMLAEAANAPRSSRSRSLRRRAT